MLPLVGRDMELQDQKQLKDPRIGHNRPFFLLPPMLRALPSYLNFTRAYTGRDKLDLYPLMPVICSIKLLYASNMPADLVCLLFRPFVFSLPNERTKKPRDARTPGLMPTQRPMPNKASAYSF